MINNKNYIINFIYSYKILLFIFYIFFFDLGLRVIEIKEIKFSNIDSRLLFIFILPFFIYEIFRFKLSKKYFLGLLYFVIFVICHWFYLNYINNFDITLKDLLKFFISVLYIIVFSFYLEFIKKNILKIIELFLLIYFLLIVLNMSFDYFTNQIVCIFGCFSKNREIFKEASHFAYIAPLIYVYYLNVVPLNKINKFNKFLLVFFVISTSQNLSTTLLATVIISLFLILLFNFKEIPNKKNFLIILLIFTLIIPFHKNTLLKINHFYDVSFLLHIQDNYSLVKIYNQKKKSIESDSLPPKKKNIVSPIQKKRSANLSVEVLITNTKLAINSLKENLLGWGMHNYKHAHKFYIDDINTSNVQGTAWLNSTDGSNNFNKGIVEFGILFLIPIILLFGLLIDKKIEIEIKLLIFPILFSQIFIRGSGFFNGGFIIFLMILISLYFKKLQKKPL